MGIKYERAIADAIRAVDDHGRRLDAVERALEHLAAHLEALRPPSVRKMVKALDAEMPSVPVFRKPS